MKRYTVFIGACIMAIIGTVSAIVILAIQQRAPDLIDMVIVIVMWLPSAGFGAAAWLES